jgi:hypothetical protein
VSQAEEIVMIKAERQVEPRMDIIFHTVRGLSKSAATISAVASQDEFDNRL